MRFFAPLLLSIVACLLLMVFPGCVTTKTTAPDGTVTETRTADAATLTLVAQLISDTLDRIHEIQADDTLTAEERAAKLEAQQAKYEMLLQALATLRGTTGAAADTSDAQAE